jgi:glycosyltransferase involved in cell wall biosynthesis
MNFTRNIKKNNKFIHCENMLNILYNKSIHLPKKNKSKPKRFWENEATIWVSLLIPSYNTNKEYLVDCIKSIKEQIGNFGLEIVWINDCSDDVNTNILVDLLNTILRPLKNCKIVYKRLEQHSGISFCLNYGINLCSNEIIFRFDSDDIMKYNRIIKQLKFIISKPNCILCGTNITIFKDVNGKYHTINNSTHKNILTWDEYKKNPTDWILNHPTLCFKKSYILNIGSYKEDFHYPFEDLELELRVLKKYGILYNIQEPLVFYRIHDDQISRKMSPEFELLKKSLIQNMINDS